MAFRGRRGCRGACGNVRLTRMETHELLEVPVRVRCPSELRTDIRGQAQAFREPALAAAGERALDLSQRRRSPSHGELDASEFHAHERFGGGHATECLDQRRRGARQVPADTRLEAPEREKRKRAAR